MQSRSAQNKQSRSDARPSAGKKIIRFRRSDITQRWLITTDGCPDCAQAKKDHKIEITNGEIRVVDVGDDKGFEIIKKLNLWEVPSFVIELSDGTYIIEQ